MADTNTNSTPGMHADTAGNDAANDKGSVIDTLTGTTAETRSDFVAKAQETLSGAVETAVAAVKDNPKTAAAIAVGAAAAVAGAAYGATKLGGGDDAKGGTQKRAPAKGGAKH